MNNNLESKKRQQSIEEDDNISIVHYTSFKKIFCSILIRLLLAAIFLGIAVAALIYAFNTGEKSRGTNHGPNIPGDTYSMYISQNCSEGFMKIEEKLPKQNSNDSQQYKVTKIGSFWYQDDIKKRLVHRIGLDNEDWMYTYFIFKNYAYLDMPGKCTKLTNVTYNNYIASMGLLNMRKIEESIGIHDGKKIIEALEYENIPSSDSVYNNTHPTVTTLYLEKDSYASLRWDLRFYEKSSTSLLSSFCRETFDCPNGATCMEATNHQTIKICCTSMIKATCPINYTPMLDLNGQYIYCSMSNDNICTSDSKCLQSPTKPEVFLCCTSTIAPSICPSNQDALINNGEIETCSGPQNSCSMDGYTCQYSTTINKWVCCGNPINPIPYCKNGDLPYSLDDGEIYRCLLTESTCPQGYNCEESTIPLTNVCCNSTGTNITTTTLEPITILPITTTTVSSILSCPKNWNPYRYPTGNYHICNSVLDSTSCPFGFSCVPSNFEDVFICCRLSMSFECSKKNSTLLLNNQPRLCSTSLPNSCPVDFDCLPSTIGSINICCKKEINLKCKNGRKIGMINGNPQYCSNYGYQDTCKFGYICDNSTIDGLNVCCYVL
ncbi:Cysteine-rich repeat and Lustrin, cysteine-rich repeated domain-containing protein [Strongyloides ratti]|uniref:Cysteine-rich repeat and Lustrin, cysteine-rich repeated domain-containing protein n=1 Tax=Strongyloides ratti TaxID=34506 RepID=A0A090LLN6_STRRB|nr:Cysteine-rich repeat and Lustrin, cysteine-rich repeated domain-containing protein [Strongyloides ratti]CEF70700.1 Cysteine-rich repeat and Lustrin, cysteine-rich repeated domain-containing protein [Strongyloides ratti]